MKINKNDPRLTAYVLNELDALEKSMIEIALKADPELQSEVAQIKNSIGVFNTLAKTQDEMVLSKNQREKIFENPASSPAWTWWTVGGSLATASLALILFQQNAHESAELMVSVPVSKSVSMAPKKAAAALAKEQVAKTELQVPAELNAETDSLADDKPAALAEAKRAEPQEFEKAKNNVGSVLGASAGAGASKSATAVARPMVAARMAKDEAPAPAAPTQARARLQEMPYEMDVSLSQFLPTESEPADVEINMNLTRDLKKCFSENLSKYVRYNLKYSLKWEIQNAKVLNAGITDILNGGHVSKEIQTCVKQAFQIQKWSEVKYIRESLKPLKFEAVITIVSE